MTVTCSHPEGYQMFAMTAPLRNAIYATYTTRRLGNNRGSLHIPKLRNCPPIITRKDGSRESMSRDTAATVLRLYR